MITNNDMKQLKKEFATKDDIRKAIQENTDQLIKFMAENFSVIIEKLDVMTHELHAHRIVLGDYESRLQQLDTKT